MQADGISSHRRTRPWPWLAACLAALALLASCLQPEKPADVYVSLALETDSLQAFDTVVVVLLRGDGSGAFLDTVWAGQPPRAGDLDRVKVDGYRGGDVVVAVSGFVDGKLQYEQRIDYRGGTAIPLEPRRYDRIPPTLTLASRDVSLAGEQSLPDSFAVCRDETDGRWTIRSNDSILVAYGEASVVVAIYVCVDKGGNRSGEGRVILRRNRGSDTVAPIVALRGPEILSHRAGEPYADPGAECVDDRDSTYALTTDDRVDVHTDGTYRLRFRCADRAGNLSQERHRQVIVGSGVRTVTLPARQDAILDTTKYLEANSGLTPVLTFGKIRPVPDAWACLLAFELDPVERQGLKSAKAEFHTYISGPFVEFDSLTLVFSMHRVTSAWDEGLGSWYYHDGSYHNGGETFLLNHPPRKEIAEKALDPIASPGIAGRDRALLRLGNTPAAGKDTVTVRYTSSSFSHGHPGVVPEKSRLIKLTLDLTEYVRGTAPREDHGVVITSEGMPDNIWINWATRELGDGTLGPRLILEY